MEQTNKSQETYNPPQNVEAMIAYLIPIVTGALMLVTRGNNKFIRFHAAQAIVFWVVVFAASALANVLIFLALIVQPIIVVGATLLWLMLMYKAYSNEEYELPYIGEFVRLQLEKNQ